MFLFASISSPIKTHVYGFGSALFDGLLMIPDAVELSVCIGVGPCGCPISSNDVLSTSPSLALMNRPPNPASAVEAITFSKWPLQPIFLHYVWFVKLG